MATGELDFSNLPAFGSRKPDEETQPARGWFRAGVSSGIDSTQAYLGSALQGAGKIVGLRTVEDIGRGISERNMLEAQQNGRSDLETAPWRDGGAPVLPWIGYQAAKQLPVLAAYMAGGKAFRSAGGEAPQGLSRAAASIPRALGGGGLKSGADFAARREALVAGREMAGELTGGAIAGVPIAFGSMVQEADQKPGGATIQDVQKAALLSPVYSALDALQPAGLKGLLQRGLTGNIVRRVATASLAGAAAEVPQEAIQTAMELSFRPDMSPRDKFNQIVDAAVSGGVVGGVFGAAGGVRRMKAADPTSVATEDLNSVVGEVLGLPAPTAYVNSRGDAAVGANGMDEVRNAFRQPDDVTALPGPADVGQRAAVDGSTMVVGRNREGGRFAPGMSTVEQPPVDDTARSFRNWTTPEVRSAINVLNNQREAGTLKPSYAQFIPALEQELALRNEALTSDTLTTDSSRGGVARAEPVAGGGVSESAAPAPATQSWDTERDTLLKGIATRRWYKEASTPEEMDAILVARLEDGSTAKSDLELAKRRGIDVNAPSAPVEAAPAGAQDTTSQAPVNRVQTSETPAPAAPANEEGGDFTAEWKAAVQKTGQKDKTARSLKPTDRADAQRKLYTALGRDGEVSDGLERLAQQYGVLDANKQLTPEAVAIAQREPISTETAVKAARAQGYKGAEASMFDRGAQSYAQGSQVEQFDSDAAREAYTAGAQWAEEHNSVPRGALKRYEPRRYTGDVTDAQVAAANGQGQAPQPRVVPESATQSRTMNLAIDGTQQALGAREDDVAAMKRMVRDGDISGAMDALNRVQRGESLFEQPAPTAPDFKGEVVTRGAPRTGRVGSVTLVDTKATTRAQAERAIRRYELQRQIDAAFHEGSITGSQRLGLVNKLRQGKFSEVRAAVPNTPVASSSEVQATLAQRAARRAQLHEHLTEMMADIERESEVSELNVDDNGVLEAYRFTAGKARMTPDEKMAAAKIMAIAIDNDGDPSAVLDALEAYGRDEVGRMTKRYRKYVPEGLRVEVLTADEMAQRAEARGWGAVPIGYYESDDNTITLQALPLHPSIILHEFMHAVIGGHVHRKTGIGREITKIFDKFKQYGPKGDYAYTSANEFIAEFISRKQVRDRIASWSTDTKLGNIFERLWTAIRKALGMPAKNYVERLLDLAEQAGQQRLSPGNGFAAPYVLNDRVKSFVESISSKIPIETANASARRTVFGWNSISHLVSHYAKQFPQLAKYATVHLERRATQARWSQLFETPYQRYETLEREKPKLAEDIRYLMSLTQFQIDPTKTWAEHAHLQEASNAARLKELVETANRKYNTLRGLGHSSIYNDFRAINDATHLSMMAVSLHNLVISDPALKQGVQGFDIDPSDAFRERPALHESPQNARKYWSDVLDAQVGNAEDYITQLRGDTSSTASDLRAQALRLEPIEMRLRSIRESRNAMQNSPYFHLGRHGEHFVAFTLRTGEDKNVDPAAIDHAGRIIEAAGFKNIEISRDSTKPKVYIRVDTIEARNQLEQIARDLRAGGWLKPDTEILAAPRSSSSDVGTADNAPAWLERYIEMLQANPMYEPTDGMTDQEKADLLSKKAQMVSYARELWLDMLPDTALAKMMVHRNAVPGFDKNMIRNFAFRFQVGVNSLANLSANAKLNDAFTDMRAAVYDAQPASSPDHKYVDVRQQLLTEILVRESQRSLKPDSNWVDTWRAINHAYFLGFSPSYVAVNTTQLGVLLWPELAKKHGFAKSAKAIAGVTSAAFNIMRETLAAGVKVGPKRALDAVITEDVLTKAKGVDQATAGYLMKLIADGIIDIGGSSRELSRVADGSVSETLDTGLRWASSFGLYSETFTRLVAALAARKLQGDDIQYARNTIEQSMLNYAEWNTARQMGKLGFAGPMTKVMTSFMQYSAQVMEKLYREFHTGMINKNSTAQEKAEARRFLAGHLMAVTALAGTLGLPFATVAATVAEKLVDLFDDDDEPFDATASWRNFLAGILGKDVAEVAARGVPRALGVDLSQRAGEQNMLPFSQLLTDKRKWKEAASESALRSLGAPVSMVMNVFEGGEKIGDGDVMGGLVTMMPLSMKGPTQAYRMTDEGYTDTLGNKLPMTPGATAILAQLLGFTPSAKAEYSEARGDQAARRGVLVREAGVLRNGIAEAYMAGDIDKARELIRRAQQFDRANPKFAVLPDIEGAIERRMRQQATAAALNMPIGVAADDIGARDLTGYANIEFQPQR